tara:strand:- start:4165 stop:4743 length:579 start_codon:yes stop_codon:yes gene_type:complete
MTAGVGLALSLASAYSQFQGGRAQAAMFEGQARNLEVQAEFTRFSAKQESLKHKAAAVAELEKTLVAMAKINAAAGAGNIDPFSGNPFGLKTRALDVGGTNYAMADNNRAITVLLGEQQAQMQLYQASRARAAGKAAKSAGVMGALMTLGMSAFNFARVQAPGGNLGGQTMFDPSGAGWSSQPYSGSNVIFN